MEWKKNRHPIFEEPLEFTLPAPNIANGLETTFILGFRPIFRGFLLLVSGMG